MIIAEAKSKAINRENPKIADKIKSGPKFLWRCWWSVKPLVLLQQLGTTAALIDTLYDAAVLH